MSKYYCTVYMKIMVRIMTRTIRCNCLAPIRIRIIIREIKIIIMEMDKENGSMEIASFVERKGTWQGHVSKERRTKRVTIIMKLTERLVWPVPIPDKVKRYS